MRQSHLHFGSQNVAIIAVLLAASLSIGCSGNDGTTTPQPSEDAGATDTTAPTDVETTTDTAADTGSKSDGWVDSGGVVSENTNVLCNDGKDNDNDGTTDCDDLSCSTGIGVTVCGGGNTDKENTDETCKDGKDNDSDGKTDCDDTDCKESTLVTVCDVAVDPKKENTNAACDDGKDNDGDGYTDCKDFDCSKNSSVTVCGSSSGGKCGNGKCDSGETEKNCAKDCGKAGPNSCIGKCGEYDEKAKCQCDTECVAEKDCCTDYKAVCTSTKPVCGNGKCESGETASNCAKDCKTTTPTGSCKGKCGDYDQAASCQCDADCGSWKDCCSDFKTLCGDIGKPSTSCLAKPWHQQLKNAAPRPSVAVAGKAVWLAAHDLSYTSDLGATMSVIPWAVKACVGAACTQQPVQAEAVVALDGGGAVAAGLYKEVTGVNWNQGVVSGYDNQGKSTWSHNLLGAGTAQTAELSTLGAIAHGKVGTTLVAASMKAGGNAIARVWAVSAAGASTETTWQLKPGIAEVRGLAWSATGGLRAVGIAAGGGWLGGVTGNNNWQVALSGVTLAADVTLTDKGDCYVVGHTTVSAGLNSWLGRYNDAGKQLWVSNLGSGKQDRFDAIMAVPQGAMLVGATSPAAGQWRAWLVAVDNKGIIVGQENYGLPTSNVFATSLALPDPEGILIASRIGSESHPTGTWLLRVDGNGDGPCSGAKGATCGGSSQPCDDGQACTADACDAKTGKCTHKPAASGAPCEDGNSCTGSGSCNAGSCKAGAPLTDGLACGGAGKCKTGVCVGDKAQKPKVGDLVISELMVRAKSGNGDNGEWIELTNISSVTIDLEGLELLYKTSVKFKLTGKGKPLTIKPGGRFVIGRSSKSSDNFGATIDLVQTVISMSNSGGKLTLKAGKTTLDAVSYEKAAVVLGSALQLSSDKMTAKGNDDAKAWCTATQSFGSAGKKGTPGAANTLCKP
ncbi:MAG: lamin tail domain-containing protein [Myxococcales bacterium]|nr:lamin tail domain-containing protein [Myxococcales bacterium]